MEGRVDRLEKIGVIARGGSGDPDERRHAVGAHQILLATFDDLGAGEDGVQCIELRLARVQLGRLEQRIRHDLDGAAACVCV